MYIEHSRFHIKQRYFLVLVSHSDCRNIYIISVKQSIWEEVNN